MYELCALLSQPKTRKPRKPAAKRITVGCVVEMHGRAHRVTGRDTKYANAWFLMNSDNVDLPYSYGRDMLKVL